MNIQTSPQFKKMTAKAIVAIVLFLIVYAALTTLAVGLTALCVVGGFYVIAIRPMIITIGLGLGVASLGFFILAFLFKFMVKKHKVDRSHLIEITAHNEPKLFAFIGEIVKEAGTDFPKKVYLSSEVNAGVFYDSGFWSMFFPVRKNLQIGLGLVNTVTEQEFKAILAHEFGHFSQKSMKVGSYVYNVNQVIFNMLYDNDSFNKMIGKWASTSGYFVIFVVIASKIIDGIQWILKKMYEYINISYMALSRQMEFHADEVAANIAGASPLKESLLRMDLADASYQAVLEYYGRRFSDQVRSSNVYKEQQYVLGFLALENGLAIVDGLPRITEPDTNKFNKSKLVITDQWASHPGNDERIANLERLGIEKEVTEQRSANALFQSIGALQEKLTDQLFSRVENPDEFVAIGYDEFTAGYDLYFRENTYAKTFNGYYDNKNPNVFDVEDCKGSTEILTGEMLFANDKVDMVYDFVAMEGDKNNLKNIGDKVFEVKTFDYDGKKYKQDEAGSLASDISGKLEGLKAAITRNDIDIYCYFYNLATGSGKQDLLKSKYVVFFQNEADHERRSELYSKLIIDMGFTRVTTPFDQIRNGFKKILSLEKEMKKEMQSIIETGIFRNELTAEIRESFEMYLKEDWVYFNNENYIEHELEILFKATSDFAQLLSKGYFLLKKDLLDFQNALLLPSGLVVDPLTQLVPHAATIQ
jgi:Zn-dependent protease with chaperone function